MALILVAHREGLACSSACSSYSTLSSLRLTSRLKLI